MSRPLPSKASPPIAATPAQDAAPPSIRLHVAGRLVPGASIAATPGQAHYLANVMRRDPGDRIRVFNGADGEWTATLSELRRDRCLFTIARQLRPQTPEPDIWLAFALLKRTPTDLVVQKATELGVAAILPLFTTRTNADRTNLARLQAIATEAAEQSERLTVPVVRQPCALNAALAAWPPGRRLFACFERAAVPRLAPAAATPAGLLIGPEGGFTEAELDAIRARPFVDAVTLGPRVLRAETAAIVGLALLQAA